MKGTRTCVVFGCENELPESRHEIGVCTPCVKEIWRLGLRNHEQLAELQRRKLLQLSRLLSAQRGRPVTVREWIQLVDGAFGTLTEN